MANLLRGSGDGDLQGRQWDLARHNMGWVVNPPAREFNATSLTKYGVEMNSIAAGATEYSAAAE
jgi:hypothetical protein